MTELSPNTPNEERLFCNDVNIVVPHPAEFKELLYYFSEDLVLSKMEYLPGTLGPVTTADMIIRCADDEPRVIDATIISIDTGTYTPAELLDEIHDHLYDSIGEGQLNRGVDHVIVRLSDDRPAIIEVAQSSGRYYISVRIPLTEHHDPDDDYSLIIDGLELWGQLQDRLSQTEGYTSKGIDIIVGPHLESKPNKNEYELFVGLAAADEFYASLNSPSLPRIDFEDINLGNLTQLFGYISYDEAIAVVNEAVSRKLPNPDKQKVITHLDLIFGLSQRRKNDI